jgi:predicted molibdopterin-dependent oxidoreductase YjgC
MRVLPRGRLPLSPAQGIERGPALTITVDGQPRTAHAGETVAAALIADDGITTRRTPGGAPRGVYCGMGVCFDCLVVIDGVPNTRACMTLVADGQSIERQDGAGPAR